MKISFNKPYFDDKELNSVRKALQSGNHSGNKEFSRKLKSRINQKYPNSHVFLTPSCSAALEMGVMLSGIKPGDEVIMPSYTFSSTANAVLVFGGIPVFCDINPETMNLDPVSVEQFITSKTKMIIPIDYAGIPCDMDEISTLAKKHGIIIMLDAAQSYGSYLFDKPVGEKADLVCFSFHETKNLSCGEGGALLVNRKEWFEKAAFIQEKGTDRKRMLEGLQDRYSWISNGSSYILSDILAAILLAQFEKEKLIIAKRKIIYNAYHELFNSDLKSFIIRTSKIEEFMKVNYHSFWIHMHSNADRKLFMEKMSDRGIPAYIGYVPLHSSKMGKSLKVNTEYLPVTDELSSKIVRMPIYPDMTDEELTYIISNTREVVLENFN
ncbi:dTDP-4-amino-4,6-dideoxygalactose transaminase [Christiangramia sediminis]|uniref:dTDP-4-amino-4,6-dideoxygalactose transaminase n=1 Tax=Christiangramia sediminis TaxID=2881336 RepID=A0A9X1LHU6_9FLAO|nr:dTDP-4-amino-4,6-dideoxygalactose transaminase [Christiangramia sediminis]MCB7480632.1 dTDP-4-amino-4,6-dideoxygalactose transaminase [Christiangramia sediminis]